MDVIDIGNLPKLHDKHNIIKSLFKDGLLNIEFIYKSEYQNTKALRDFVEAICEVLGLSNNLISRMILISDELNNNAIEYGTEAWWTNIMRIIAKKVGKDVEFNLEVEDEGTWKSPKTVLDMETMRAHQLKLGYFNHDSVRWRGLFLIAVKISDRLYFKNSNKWGLIVGVKVKI